MKIQPKEYKKLILKALRKLEPTARNKRGMVNLNIDWQADPI